MFNSNAFGPTATLLYPSIFFPNASYPIARLYVPSVLTKALNPNAKFEACPPLPLPIVKPSIRISFVNFAIPVTIASPLRYELVIA